MSLRHILGLKLLYGTEYNAEPEEGRIKSAIKMVKVRPASPACVAHAFHTVSLGLPSHLPTFFTSSTPTQPTCSRGTSGRTALSLLSFCPSSLNHPTGIRSSPQVAHHRADTVNIIELIR